MRRGLTRYEAVACDPSAAYACLGLGECVSSGYCQCDSNWAVAGAQLAEGRPACNVNESFILAVRGCYVVLAIIAFLLFVFSFQEALRKRKGGGLLALLTKSLPILTMHGLSATIITLWFSRDDEGHLHNYMVHKPVTAISDWGLALALVSETVFLTSFRRRVLIIVSAQGITRASVPGRALGSQRGLIVTASCIMGVFSMPLIGLSLGNQRVIRAGFCCMAIVDTYLASSTVRIMSHLAIHLRAAVSSAPSGARSTQKLRQMLWRCYLLRAVDGCVQIFTTLCHLSLGLFFETLFPFSEYTAVTVLTLGLVDAIVHSALSVLRKKNKQRRLSNGTASKRRRVTPSATAASGLSTVAASASGAALDLACDAACVPERPARWLRKRRKRGLELTLGKRRHRQQARLRPGAAWHGMAWHGMAWHGMAAQTTAARPARRGPASRERLQQAAAGKGEEEVLRQMETGKNNCGL